MIANDTACARDITVGTWKSTDWIVLSGLKEGDRVITDHIQRMRNKLPVKPIEEKN